jgi:hypothetical protein
MNSETQQGVPANHADEIPGNKPSRSRPAVTFMGNAYDLTSLGALASGVLILFMCFTCNMGYYCLPFIPLVLGLVGIIASRNAVDSQRTATFSWIGLAIGIVILILLAACVVAYFGLLGWIIFSNKPVDASSAALHSINYFHF